MFWIENKQFYTPVNPSFIVRKVCTRGYTLYRHVSMTCDMLLSKKHSAQTFVSKDYIYKNSNILTSSYKKYCKCRTHISGPCLVNIIQCSYLGQHRLWYISSPAVQERLVTCFVDSIFGRGLNGQNKNS